MCLQLCVHVRAGVLANVCACERRCARLCVSEQERKWCVPRFNVGDNVGSFLFLKLKNLEVPF